jgi:predicted dehydrogenase
MEPVRWGVLSTSAFAASKFIPSIQQSPMIDVVAVASRDAGRAAQYASDNHIPVSYGSYEELLIDDSIEVVYNPLPNSLHVEWTKRAAEAGKHVMCEKPMGINAAELDALVPLADRVHIAEAFMVRYHPQWIETREVVRSGVLGRISHMHVAFSYNNGDPTNIRNIASVGGGAMYDIGCYAVVAARWFLESDPVRVAAIADRDPTFGTDRTMTGVLDFGDGRTCTFGVATQTVYHQRANIYGEKGRIESTIPFKQLLDEPMVYLTHDGSSVAGLDATHYNVAAANQYMLLAEAFSRRVRQEAPTPAALRDAMMNMRILDAVFRSAESGRFEQV